MNLFADLLGDDEPAPDTGAKFVRIGTITKMIGLSRSTILRLAEKGDFPKPVKIGSGTFWVKGEIREWMAAKLANR